jgi:hypothetical protein
MKKTIFALAAAATIAVGTLAAPTTADARCTGCIIGGAILGGAIIGGAIANSGPGYYGPVRGYEAYPNYYGGAPVDCPGGYWARRPMQDGYGNFVGYSRPRYFCP